MSEEKDIKESAGAELSEEASALKDQTESDLPAGEPDDFAMPPGGIGGFAPLSAGFDLEGGFAAQSPGAETANFADDGFDPIPDDELDRLRRDITAGIKTVFDPEIPVDIYELGLIYRVDIHNDRSVDVEMTLTSPGCPVAGDMPGWVVDAIAKVDGVKAVRVRLSFDPPWDMSMMSEEARFALNMF